MMRKVIAVFGVALFSFVCGVTSWSDVVNLKSGGQLEGIITEEADYEIILTLPGGGKIKIKRDIIDSIEESTPEERRKLQKRIQQTKHKKGNSADYPSWLEPAEELLDKLSYPEKAARALISIQFGKCLVGVGLVHTLDVLALGATPDDSSFYLTPMNRTMKWMEVLKQEPPPAEYRDFYDSLLHIHSIYSQLCALYEKTSGLEVYNGISKLMMEITDLNKKYDKAFRKLESCLTDDSLKMLREVKKGLEKFRTKVCKESIHGFLFSEEILTTEGTSPPQKKERSEQKKEFQKRAANVISSSQESARPKDVEGWNNARWDMTEEQIKTVFKGQVEKLKKPIKYHRWYVSLRIKNLDIGGDPYEVHFQMDDRTKQLKQVLIKSKRTEVVFGQLFESLNQMLVEKYGPETYKDDRHKKFWSETAIAEFTTLGRKVENPITSSKFVRSWVFPTTTIDLSYSTRSSSLILRYHLTKVEENI